MSTDINNEESHFSHQELFFSRTDGAGVIKSGNNIFQRVSEYDWEDLLHTPHKIVRHEDMPKGVFFLFWDTIQKGHPIGAYVKNKSKTGKHYWVFALAIPIEGGYVSLRLKPSSPIFEAVQSAYKELLKAENNSSLTPEASSKILLSTIQKLGFADYPEFMSTALATELQSRATVTQQPEISSLKLVAEMIKSCDQLASESKDLISNFKFQISKKAPCCL